MDVEVIESLRHEMVAHRDANKAISMKAYMKEHFDFLGVSSPQRRLIQKQFLDLLKESDPWDVAYLLWDQPEREFQYIALDFLKKIGSKKYAKEDHHQLRELITTKSWWDTVDGLASNNVGTYFLAFPEMSRPQTS